MNHVHVGSDGEIWGAWGSCQYDSSKAFFDQLLKMNFLEAMEKTRFKFKGVRSLPEAISEFKASQMEDLKDYSYDDDWLHDPIGRLDMIATVEDMFEYGRDSAWDLWSAVPQVVSAFFEENDWDFSNLDTPPKPQGLPLLNQMTQDREADDTGFMCWVCYMFLNCDEGAFYGFDT